MEEAFLRFQHLPEQILEQLDNKSLVNSRVVAISWREFVGDREYPLKRFKKVIADMNENCRNGQTPFHLACEMGQAGIAEAIMRSSAKLNIDLNAKIKFSSTVTCYACVKCGQTKMVDLNGWTAFHFACFFGKTSIVQLMLSKSEYHKLDFTAEVSGDNGGRTGFCLAEQRGQTDILKLIESKMPINS